MKLTPIAICALIACASPAAAQSRWAYETSAVSPYEIRATLRAMHLRPVSRPGWLGRYIAVRAVDGRGEVVRVLLDPRYGNVISVVPLPRAAVAGYRPYGAHPYRPDEAPPYRPYGAAPRYGEAPPDFRPEPTPPRTAVNPPESRAAALTPPRLPLPRPRPAGSGNAASANVVPEPVARPSSAPAPEPVARANPAPVEQPAPTTGAAPPVAPTASFPPVPSFE